MTAPAPPLFLSADPVLLDDLLRLAAVAGVEPNVASSSAEARRMWVSASLVVVGHDLLADVVAGGLPQRADVVVATRDDVSVEPWRAAVALAAEHVAVLPLADAFLVERLAEGSRPGAPRARVIGVIGGSGGAGASVLAVAIAVAGARLGRDCVLVDADPDSGGLDLALGAEEAPGARWSDFADVTGILAPDTLRAALPVVHGIEILSVGRHDDVEPLPRVAVPAVVDSAAAAFDLVVLDLPRRAGDVLAGLLPRCDVVLVVVTPDVRGASAAQRLVTTLRPLADVRAVVRSVPGTDLDAVAVAGWLGLDLAAEIAHDPRLTAALDRGDPPGLSARSRLGRTAQALLTSLLDS